MRYTFFVLQLPYNRSKYDPGVRAHVKSQRYTRARGAVL